MHMLHSRRKAEIEILTTMKPSRPADKPLRLLTDGPHQLENGSVQHCPPCHGATDDLANCCTGSHYSDYSNTASSTDSLVAPIPIGLCYSSSPTTSVYQSTPPPHAQLLRYLVCKMSDFITQAEARTYAMEMDAGSL